MTTSYEIPDVRDLMEVRAEMFGKETPFGRLATDTDGFRNIAWGHISSPGFRDRYNYLVDKEGRPDDRMNGYPEVSHRWAVVTRVEGGEDDEWEILYGDNVTGLTPRSFPVTVLAEVQRRSSRVKAPNPSGSESIYWPSLENVDKAALLAAMALTHSRAYSDELLRRGATRESVRVATDRYYYPMYAAFAACALSHGWDLERVDDAVEDGSSVLELCWQWLTEAGLPEDQIKRLTHDGSATPTETPTPA